MRTPHVPQEITPGRIESELEGLSYPVVRPEAAAELRDVILVVDDREVNLGGLVSDTTADAYHTADELAAELEGLETLPESPLG